MKAFAFKVKFFIVLVLGAGLFLLVFRLQSQHYKKRSIAFAFKEGDVLFQESNSRQCEAVKLATHSPLSHCGIYFTENGKGYVYEAINPVVKTPLEEWIDRGIGSKFLVSRLKADKYNLDSAAISKLKNEASLALGKPYDIYFSWSDEELYCSEYVWKVYKNALGLEICHLRKFKDFDLTHPKVQEIITQRYGKNVPMESDVVAPNDLYVNQMMDCAK